MDISIPSFSSPSLDIAVSVFVPSFLALFAVFRVLSTRFTTPKQVSWVITAVSSCIMTLLSLPYVYDFFFSGGHVGVLGVREASAFSVVANRFFQAYLAVDLISGLLYYRSEVNLFTGWGHHVVYLVIVEYAIRNSWSNIFCLCAVMEFPTFVLGLSCLYPQIRSNIFFAASFFLTRILLHLFLIFSYILPENRKSVTQGSYAPSILLTCIFPLHAMWFRGCINGFIRRAAKRNASSPRIQILRRRPTAELVQKHIVQPVFTRLRLRRSYHYDRLRRQDVAKILRSLQNEYIREPRIVARRVSQNVIVSLKAGRQTMYRYVGLGRKAQTVGTM